MRWSIIIVGVVIGEVRDGVRVIIVDRELGRGRRPRIVVSSQQGCGRLAVVVRLLVLQRLLAVTVLLAVRSSAS